MFAIDFDRSSIKMNERIWNMTSGLVKNVLENAGVADGCWVLRSPHRMRKKGPERFKALRLEYNGKASGIRIRCKPQGNETSFEYTLVPPEDKEIDIENLYKLLLRVNAKTLKIYENIALKIAIENPEFRNFQSDKSLSWPKRKIIPLKKQTPAPVARIPAAPVARIPAAAPVARIPAAAPVARIPAVPPTRIPAAAPVAKVQAAPAPVVQSEATTFSKFPTAAERLQAWKQHSAVNENHIANKKEISKTIETSEKTINNTIEKISKLNIIEDTILSDQEVLDKALVSIAFVSINGYSSRIEASNSLINNLDLNNFIENISKQYTSIEGAMRSIIMALRKNNYIERIYYSRAASKKIKSSAVRGYVFTPKAEKRICALKKFLGENINIKLRHNWAKFENENASQIESSSTIESSTIESSTIESSTIESSTIESSTIESSIEDSIKSKEKYLKLESLISSLKSTDEQIEEAEEFIKELRREIEDFSVELLVVEKAIEEQIKQKEEIEKRIKKITEKKLEIKEKEKEKEKEIEEWRKFQQPYAEEKIKIKKEIEEAARQVGIELKK